MIKTVHFRVNGGVMGHKANLFGHLLKIVWILVLAAGIAACASAPQSQEPVPGTSYFNRAVDAESKGRYLAAIEQYTRYIDLHKDAPEYAVPALNNRGTVYWTLGRHENAIQDFTRAAKMDPNNPQTYINRGNVRADMGEIRDAIQDYTHAIDLDEENGLAYSNRGLAWSSLKRFDRAIPDFDRAIGLGHEGVYRSHMKRGVILFGTKDYQGALEDFNRVIKLMPNYAEAYYFRGQIYHLLNEPEKAEKDFNSAMALKQGLGQQAQ